MEIPILMPHQMEPFNGDTFIEQEFLSLKKLFNIDTVIETGTCIGSTTLFFANHFKKVITIEINDQYLEIARTLIGHLDNIHMYSGASEKILSDVPEAGSPITNNTIFFLDAHWGTHCPLKEELQIIAGFKIRPVIVIHDFEVPGQPGLGFDSYEGQAFTIGWIEPLLQNIYGSEGYGHYYNSEENSTEIKRGVIYITPK